MLRRIVSASVAVLTLCATRAAFAQDPAPPTEPVVANAQSGGVTCTLGAHPGVPDLDAATARDIACSELAHRTSGGTYEVSFAKLGTRLYMILSNTSGGQREERRAQINGIEEAEIASQRLAEAMVQKVTLAATEQVNNVLAKDAVETERQHKGRMSFLLGVVGATAPGASGPPAAGMAFGLHYRVGDVGVVGDLNFAVNDTVKYVVISTGARWNIGQDATAPYIGGGMGISGVNVNDGTHERGNGGLSGYVEGGAEFLRTSAVGFSAGVRAELPFYAVKNGSTNDSAYAVPISLIAGLRFN